jgi:hypothetical protein
MADKSADALTPRLSGIRAGKNWKARRRSGQVVMMFTLLMVPLFGVAGLVIDLGYLHYTKMSAQTAAEAAAMAAIIDFHANVGGASPACGQPGIVCAETPVTCPQTITTPSSSLEKGCMYAQSHGFTGSNRWVTYQAGVGSTPPTKTGMGSASYWVVFRVMQKVSSISSAIFDSPSGLVAARSTAAVIGASDCIYALNPTADGAVQVNGAASLNSACGIYVNSNSPSALGTNGGGSISAPEYDVVGGVNTHYTLTPAPSLGVSPVSDPLANLPVPASAPYTCNYFKYSAPNYSNPTLTPGVYCGGIDVQNNIYTLTPGIYILVGGGLKTQSANSHVVGNGVLIYNTFGATTNHGNISYDPIDLNANSTVELRAPRSGTYAGILFFEDRASPACDDEYGGGTSAVYEGTIYARNAAVYMSGNSGADAAYTLVVANTINFVGTSGMNNNYSLLPNGSPIQQVVRVE